MPVQQVTPDNVQRILESKKKLVLLDFSAEWCGPCQLMKSAIESLAQQVSKEDIVVAEVDVDRNDSLVAELRITNVPTLIFLRQGKEAKRVTGLFSAKEMLEMINSLVDSIF